jgi:hypothetical protein
MRENSTDVDSIAIIMESGNQSVFIPSDIEDCLVANLISTRKNGPERNEIRESTPF